MKLYSTEKFCEYLDNKYDECLKKSCFFILDENNGEPVFLCYKHGKLAKEWGK